MTTISFKKKKKKAFLCEIGVHYVAFVVDEVADAFLGRNCHCHMCILRYSLPQSKLKIFH